MQAHPIILNHEPTTHNAYIPNRSRVYQFGHPIDLPPSNLILGQTTAIRE